MGEKSPKATIYDVARVAGVSISTVSLALNAPDQVQPVTRSRVIAAVDALGYVPKAEAAARARKGTKRVGVLAPFFPYPSFSQRLRGIATALADSPYELVIYNIDSAARLDGYFVSLPLSGRLDGLIAMALTIDDAVAERFLRHATTLVLVEYLHPAFSGVLVDNQAGGQMVASYLLERGYQRCAFVGDSSVPDYTIKASSQRLAGYAAALAAAGRPLQAHCQVLVPHGLEQAEAATHRLLDLAEPPDAIFAPSDMQAMGVLKAVRERGMRPKDDLAVVGFDDIEMASYVGLTTVRQGLDESGRTAAELLVAQLHHADRPVQHVSLPLALVVRGSA